MKRGQTANDTAELMLQLAQTSDRVVCADYAQLLVSFVETGQIVNVTNPRQALQMIELPELLYPCQSTLPIQAVY